MEWESAAFIGREGRNSTWEKPKLVPKGPKRVRFLEIVEVREFAAEQKPSMALEVFSGTMQLKKKKPLAFFGGHADT